MRQFRVISILTVLTAICFSTALYGITADEIVANHLEAKGGLDKLKDLETVHMKGTMMMSGMQGQFELWNKAPNLHAMHVKVQGMTIEEGSDGENVWSVTPMGMNKFEGKQLEQRLEQTRLEPLLGFKDRGGSYELVGKEPVKGEEAYKVRFIQGTGDTTYSFFDTDTYYMIKTSVSTPQGEAEQFFKDFKTVDGYVFPGSITTAGQQGRVMIKIDQIEVNKPVADSLFVMPNPDDVPTVMKPLPDSMRKPMPGKDDK